MKLYSYWRSTAAYRVRIALNLKNVHADHMAVRLSMEGGENLAPDFRAVNPQAKIPALVLDDGSVIAQSMAILNYLDETYPNPPLLPPDSVQKAQVRAFSLSIVSDLHPLNNVGVLRYLKNEMHAEEAAIRAWYYNWAKVVMTGLEAEISGRPERQYCFGDAVTLADLCLVPQFYNLRRWDCPLDAYPRLTEIDRRLMELEAFEKAAPENQPDAEPAG